MYKNYYVSKMVLAPKRALEVFNPFMVFRSVGPVYYTLKTGPTDPSITQGLTNAVFNIN